MTLEGGCRCGAVRYELAGAGLPLTYACHCLDCQTWSGSAFTLHAISSDDVLSVRGNLHQFRLPEGQEAMASDHIGCAACLTRIATRNPALPNMVVLRVGTLDKSDAVEPALRIWTRRKQAWVKIDEALPTFEGSPTPAEFAAAVSR